MDVGLGYRDFAVGMRQVAAEDLLSVV